MQAARYNLRGHAVQGNLDPIVLFTDKDTIYAAVEPDPQNPAEKASRRCNY